MGVSQVGQGLVLPWRPSSARSRVKRSSAWALSLRHSSPFGRGSRASLPTRTAARRARVRRRRRRRGSRGRTSRGTWGSERTSRSIRNDLENVVAVPSRTAPRRLRLESGFRGLRLVREPDFRKVARAGAHVGLVERLRGFGHRSAAACFSKILPITCPRRHSRSRQFHRAWPSLRRFLKTNRALEGPQSRRQSRRSQSRRRRK
mmetsp:Transcript_14051/g.42497  ORF Transcript_14051/g.42497 Transcript_14051/m.42497 type:complete len:204 (+) Transcript_14051:276-887(+)